jgi:hypothetical protein
MTSHHCLTICSYYDAAISKASYGTPTGSCPSYAVGKCNAANTTAIVERLCLGQNACTIDADTPLFGDPCFGVGKSLVVVARCSTGGGGQPGALVPPTDLVNLPSYIKSVTLQTPQTGGFCGARVKWAGNVTDPRMLQPPSAGGASGTAAATNVRQEQLQPSIGAVFSFRSVDHIKWGWTQSLI